MNFQKIYSNFHKYYYIGLYYNNEVFIISNKKLDLEKSNLEDLTIILQSRNVIKLLDNDNQIIIVNNFSKKKLNNINLKNITKDEDIIDLIETKSNKKINLKYCLLEETYKNYNKKIKPYIKSIYKLNTKWIYDIISFKKEINKIIFDCDDFIIVKELSMVNSNTFYLLGFPKIENIYTIRELKKKDLIWLESMKNKFEEIALKLYGFSKNELCLFFHYHPSFYYIHLHCTFIGNSIIDNKFQRNILYQDIRLNLLNNKNYYKKTFYFEIPKNHILQKLIKNEI